MHQLVLIMQQKYSNNTYSSIKVLYLTQHHLIFTRFISSFSQ